MPTTPTRLHSNFNVAYSSRLRTGAGGSPYRSVNFAAHVLQLLIGFDARHALVHPQALVFLRDVVGRNTNVEPEIELDLGLFGLHLALELADGLLEHRRVHLEADGVDLSALLAAEQVAGAADFEVERGDAESAAEVAELLDRRQRRRAIGDSSSPAGISRYA